MSIEAITAKLLDQPSIKAIVGTRISLGQRPANGSYPALVYQTVDSEPILRMGPPDQRELRKSRVQITVLAVDAPAAVNLRETVQSALRYMRGDMAGHLVLDVIEGPATGTDKDNDAGVWFTTADFHVTWYV